MPTTANEYLVLLIKSGKSLKPLKDQFYSLGGFYNGIGYAFPSSSETMISQIVKALGSRLIKMPLGSGQTFEQLKQAQKAIFFREKLIEAEQHLLVCRSDLNIDEITEETVIASSASDFKKEEAIELLHECERLRDSIEWAEKMEKALQVNVGKSLELLSIAELSLDYFTKQPPEKPRLLYFVEKDGSKSTFLHKEIASMLVGEGGRGKTHLLALLGASVATGIPFLGQIEVEKPGAVCFVVGENNHGDIHRLLFKIHRHLEEVLKRNKERGDGKHFGLHYENPLEHLPPNFIPVSVHGMNSHFIGEKGDHTSFYNQFLAQLKAKEPEGGFQLIILDPASRFAGPDAEKDNAIATSFIACLERISEELKGRPTILLSHHKSKSAIRENGVTQADARGSSGLTDGVRWQGNLSKGESNEHSVLEVTKTNFTAYPKKLVMKKGKDGVPEFIRWDEHKETITQPHTQKKKSTSGDDKESDYDLARYKGGGS